MQAIKAVRNWLNQHSGDATLPGPKKMADRYGCFRADLPSMLEEAEIEEEELVYNDYTGFVVEWLKANP